MWNTLWRFEEICGHSFCVYKEKSVTSFTPKTATADENADTVAKNAPVCPLAEAPQNQHRRKTVFPIKSLMLATALSVIPFSLNDEITPETDNNLTHVLDYFKDEQPTDSPDQLNAAPNNVSPFIGTALETATGGSGQDPNTRVLEGFRFALGQHRIPDGDLPVETLVVLDELYALNKCIRYYLVGHTDNTGDETTNQKLSLLRAAFVREVLVNTRGIPFGSIIVSGIGSDNPLASNDTAGGRKENRRVEITCVAH